ncbi:MFS transporter, DHA3 family, macrolide efflux protein [Sphaerochaeta associata]|uniref:MFS transporter n=1 Tax=Sphaerochaeta associata TaxID=1129264 RepID=A0ABY4D7Q1_9SPIR|nr:MFS transporter [Sphaerochaeta associata]UOM50225.1 MFS transporter [Sphaerochaeta associata]SMP43617.1 MFS transporter, DHA3 family, macrolide efflux protein [Sphaerochaeta associata]
MQGWKTKTILFLASQGITLFGSSIVQFALVWYITLQSSSGVWVSALTLCAFVPQFLVSFVSGALSDRCNKKYLIIASDAVIAAATLALVLLVPRLDSDTTVFYALLVVSIVRSAGSGVQIPAVASMIPLLVPAEQLMRFNGLNAALTSLVQFASPFAAGAFLTLSSLRSTLLLDVSTAVVGICLLAFLLIPHEKKQTGKTSLFQDVKQGAVYALQNRWVGKMLMVHGLFIFLAVPAGFLATLFVTRYYKESYAYMTIVEVVGFAGMSLGGVLMSTWGGFKNQVTSFLAGMSAFGILAIGMGLIDSFIVYLALMAIYGIALTMVQTATMTLLQQRTDTSMQGRIFAFLNIMYSGALPLGMALFGPLSDVVSMRVLMVLSGVLLMLLVLKLRFDRQFYSSSSSTMLS